MADFAPVEDTLRFIRKGLGVSRYHQRYTAVKDTVGKHSAGVATLLLLLHRPTMPRAQLLAAALVHDVPEAITGDIPSPAKRAMSYDARAALNKQEEDMLEVHGLNWSLDGVEKSLLKLADSLDGLIFCTEERNRGNKEVVEVGEVYVGYVNELLVRHGSMFMERLDLTHINELSLNIIDQWDQANARR